MPRNTTASTATVTAVETTIRQGLLRCGAAVPWAAAAPGPGGGPGSDTVRVTHCSTPPSRNDQLPTTTDPEGAAGPLGQAWPRRRPSPSSPEEAPSRPSPPPGARLDDRVGWRPS